MGLLERFAANGKWRLQYALLESKSHLVSKLGLLRSKWCLPFLALVPTMQEDVPCVSSRCPVQSKICWICWRPNKTGFSVTIDLIFPVDTPNTIGELCSVPKMLPTWCVHRLSECSRSSCRVPALDMGPKKWLDEWPQHLTTSAHVPDARAKPRQAAPRTRKHRFQLTKNGTLFKP
jgi:hypothetical protein